jgi:amino acid transporter
MNQPRPVLTLFDSTCLIVGIIIGVGVYQVAPDVARGVGGPWGMLGLWVLGGVLSLCGALCYAELATAYPQAGGDYVYLTRAYGPWAGFLFGWAQLTVVRPGDIAVMAFAFATYGATLHDPWAASGFGHTRLVYAAGAVVVLTTINVLGVRQGKWTQNVLTVVKVAGLLLVAGAALIARPQGGGAPMDALPLSLALILVLFSYGGWNEMAYVAAEVRNARRNIVRALLLGTVAVMALYLLVNGAFLRVLGFEGVRASGAVAADAMNVVLPGHGGRLISALVCLSALGAVNGLILTGARISFAMGQDHRGFRALGRWHDGRQTPAVALVVQGALALILILALGSFLNAILYTAAAVYSFYLATSLAVLVLRRKEPQMERPYRVTGYPWTPLAFAAVCGFLVQSAVRYKPTVALAACGLLLAGVPVYVWSRRRGRMAGDQ